MKLKKMFASALFALAGLFCVFNAQNYVPISIQGGFNQDVIANGIGAEASKSITASLDDGGYALVSDDYKYDKYETNRSYGLPVNGFIESAVESTKGLTYQLQSYSQNNSLRLDNISDSGTITFSDPLNYKNLYMLATSGSGVSTVDVIVHFEDNTFQTFPSLSIKDWFGGSGFAIQGIGRISSSSSYIETSLTQPRLYQIPLSIDVDNYSKIISSVTITKISSSGITNVFAFSGEIITSCSVPTDITAKVSSMDGATINWNASSSSPANGYDYYLDETGVSPTASTIPTGNTTSTSISFSDLENGKTYYFWVRSNCGEDGLSFWAKTEFTPGEISVTYRGGDIPTEYNDGVISNSSTTSCPGTLSVTIPPGYKISNTKVFYKMSTSSDWSYNTTGTLSHQRSFLVCTTNGVAEANVFHGAGYGQVIFGTKIYDRPNLDIANDLTGTVNFELRALRISGGSGCSTQWNKVDNDSWKITVTIVPDETLATSNISKTPAIRVSPNPFSDYVQIDDVAHVVSISVLDISGKLVKKINKPNKQVDLSDLKSGIYLLIIQKNDGKTERVKVIKY